MRFLSEMTRGIIKENPTFRLVLGMCPTLALTTSLENAIGMGVAATFVLIGSNAAISALRNVIPSAILRDATSGCWLRFDQPLETPVQRPRRSH